jgi:hypothetical protein
MQVPPNPAARPAMEDRIRILEKEHEQLQSLVQGDFYSVQHEAFVAATGFRNADHARKELRESGCASALEQMDRHKARPPLQHFEQARNILLQALPGLEDAVHHAYELEAKKAGRQGPKAKQGRKASVGVEHLFLLPFLYIFGGLFEWAGHFLPGFHISQSQTSVLLQNSVPVLAKHWAPRYFCPRGLDWLRKFCPREESDPSDADFALFLDGTKLPQERDSGFRGQRAGYSEAAKTHIGQFIGVTNAKGWIVDATPCLTPLRSESEIVWQLKLWDRINEEGYMRDEVVHAHLILDRGFRDLKNQMEKDQSDDDWPFPHLRVTCEIVEHLGTKEDPQRAQHDAPEAEKNRAIQARRWVNEKAFGFFKQAHFFDRTMRASTLYHINDIIRIGLALANMRLGCPCSEKKCYLAARAGRPLFFLAAGSFAAFLLSQAVLCAFVGS